MEYGLFWGAGATQPATLALLTTQFGVNSTTGAGLIASPADGKSALANVVLPATTYVGETDVWVQVGAWSAAYGTDWQAAKTAFDSGVAGVAFGLSVVRNSYALGKEATFGVPIWQAATGTDPKLINAFVIPVNVPELGLFALAGLGFTAMLIFRRRQ
jgi:hypothetical protein